MELRCGLRPSEQALPIIHFKGEIVDLVNSNTFQPIVDLSIVDARPYGLNLRLNSRERLFTIQVAWD